MPIFIRPVAQFRRKTRRFFATFPSYNENVICEAPEQSQVSVKPRWLLLNS